MPLNLKSVYIHSIQIPLKKTVALIPDPLRGKTCPLRKSFVPYR